MFCGTWSFYQVRGKRFPEWVLSKGEHAKLFPTWAFLMFSYLIWNCPVSELCRTLFFSFRDVSVSTRSLHDFSSQHFTWLQSIRFMYLFTCIFYFLLPSPLTTTTISSSPELSSSWEQRSWLTQYYYHQHLGQCPVHSRCSINNC